MDDPTVRELKAEIDLLKKQKQTLHVALVKAMAYADNALHQGDQYRSDRPELFRALEL